MRTVAMPIDVVLERLHRVSKSGAQWLALCPAHDDRSPSLSIAVGDDERVLLTCHAGCGLEDILDAIELKVVDLFPERDRPEPPPSIYYEYTDEAGRPLMRVVRTVGKNFFQQSPDGVGGWRNGLNGARRPLYKLPLVIEAVGSGVMVWIAEGEKDVDRLVAAGVVATCNPGGAGKWHVVQDAQTVLAGASITIVQDKDEPGRSHGHDVAHQLLQAGCTVRIVEAKEGKDAFDHLAAGFGLDDFVVVDDPSVPAASVATEPGRRSHLPAEFWSSRPALAHVHAAARRPTRCWDACSLERPR